MGTGKSDSATASNSMSPSATPSSSLARPDVSEPPKSPSGQGESETSSATPTPSESATSVVMDYDDDSDDEDSDFSLHWLFLLVTGTFTGMLVSLAAFACVLAVRHQPTKAKEISETIIKLSLCLVQPKDEIRVPLVKMAYTRQPTTVPHLPLERQAVRTKKKKI